MTWIQQEELAIHSARMILDRIISDYARIEYSINKNQIPIVHAFDVNGKHIMTEPKSSWDKYIKIAKRDLGIKW